MRYLPLSVGQSVIVSDVGDIYRIYNACELVLHLESEFQIIKQCFVFLEC